jgi:signal transduction histidine kinase
MVEAHAQRQLSALVEAGMVLASELKLDALLQRIADLAREVIGAQYAAVGVVGEAGDLVEFVYSGIDKPTADKIGDLPRGRGVLGVLIQEDRPLRMPEISDHPNAYGFPEHHPEMHSFLGVPITVRGHVFGRLYLAEKQEQKEFNKDDERLALTLAAQAGIAIDNARLYEEVRSRGDQLARHVSYLASFERVGDLAFGQGSVDETLHTAAEEARKLTGAHQSIVALYDETTGEMVVRQAVAEAGIGIAPGTRFPSKGSKSQRVMDRLRGEIVEDMEADPEVHAATYEALGRPRAGAFVPIAARGRGRGVLAVHDTTRASFTQDDLAIMQILANQVAIALENERLGEALRSLAVLEERDRISKELHDGVIQSIYSVGLALQGTLSVLDRDVELSRKRIDDAIRELDNVVRDVRSYIFELQPYVVAGRGFSEAIVELLRDHEVNTLAHTAANLEPEACDALAESQKGDVVQIVREVLSNIARHSQATEVELSCSMQDRQIVLQISDNGSGFDPQKVTRGQGLTNIEDRARKLGGDVQMEKRRPRGMMFALRIPTAESTTG